METNSSSLQKFQFRLKQTPIDVWSTREKLCLASSVQRSGDQNWYSVSRSLRALCDSDRPNDWFSQKNCALQYKDLLEKIEAEIPKRKRGERTEEIAEDIIVRKLTNERIEELKKLVALEKDKRKAMRRELEAVINKTADENTLKQIWNRKNEEEKAAIEAELKHKKWLQEREVKIAAMKASRGVNRQLKYSITNPITPNLTKTVSETKSEISKEEPLKVDIDSEEQVATTVAAPVNDNKLSLSLSPPSTSPLLTSLLQSPTASTPSILSPNMSGLLTTKDRTSSPFPHLPSIPNLSYPFVSNSDISSTVKKVTQSPEKIPVISGDKNDNLINNISSVNQTVDIENHSSPALQNQALAPTLSKLLEMPTVPGKLHPLPIAEAQSQKLFESADQQPQLETEEVLHEKSESTDISKTFTVKSPQKAKQDFENKVNIDLDKSERVETLDENISETIDSSESLDNAINSNKNTDEVNEINADSEKINTVYQNIEFPEIKREIIDDEEEEEESEKLEERKNNVKEELTDNIATSSSNESKLLEATNSTRKRRRGTTSVGVTPASTRRSNRVKALRDMKTANDESTEVSDVSSAATTPLTTKKRGSIDDNTTEASMSEESMDASKANPIVPFNESVPNSPASSTMQSEDAENIRENKLWKKSIMLVWRTASTHKFASLFSHPVTDDDAEGYTDVVHRPTDLQTIRKRIENGSIKTTAEFQRDIMLMFQNAIMFNNANHDVHQMAVEMQKEIIESIEDFIETQQQSNQTNESKLRGRERRTTASTTLSSEYELGGRRKSRGASTDTEPGLTQLKSLKKKKT